MMKILVLKVFIIVLFIIKILHVQAQTWPPTDMQGSGTESSPWEIVTAAHLKALADYVNVSSSNGYSTQGKFYKLMNNLDLTDYSSGSGWEPIKGFQGNFDGNNKIVKNLTINRPTEDEIGLFGRIGYSLGGVAQTIQNLGIENCNIKGKKDVGGLIGIIYVLMGNVNVTILNCHVVGNVAGIDNIGGLAGYDCGYGTFSDCYVTGNIIGNDYVGGLVGRGTTISNCHASCNVTGNSYVGGLIGHGNTIVKSYATGNISSSGNGSVGGLAGYGASISECYATGNVSVSNGTYNSSIGGLAGGGLTISNCYATGNVKGEKSNFVGGLVGMTYVSISNCYTSGNISSTGYNCYVGGIVGFSNGSIKNCIGANDSVTTTYSGCKRIDRISGYGSGQNCYALNTMALLENGNNVSFSLGCSGIDKSLSALRTLSFYTTPSNWSDGAWSITVPSGIWNICNGVLLPHLRYQNINCPPFVSITSITGVPTTAIIYTPLALTGTIAPNNATNKNITWNIKSEGGTGATITGSILEATASGMVIITATIECGISPIENYTKDFTISVTKALQTAPDPPTLASSTSTSITLNTISGCEYCRDNGNWQISPIFTELTPNTSYTFTQRKAETETHLASQASIVAQFKTEEDVGINDYLFGNISVLPNPTTGELQIQSSKFKVQSVEVFDPFGRNLKPQTSNLKPHTSINISNLSAGIYFLKITTETGIVSKKIIKN